MALPDDIISITMPDEMTNWRLDRALAASITTLSRERLKRLIAGGRVSCDHILVRDPAAKVKAQLRYVVNIPAALPMHNEAQNIPLNIVYEDNHLLIVDKTAGLVVHPAAGNFDGTLVNALLHHCAGRLSGIGGVARPGIVHRIDKDTSGLLVVAKTDRAHEGLAKQFARHSIDRGYRAIVAGVPRAVSGSVDAPLARSPLNRKKIAIVKDGHGKRAVTHWSLIRALNDAAMIECRLETGRTHQVRVHMASLGHSLLGDPVYGVTRTKHTALLKTLGFHRQALHAARLGFIHPISSETLTFTSDIPDDMQRLFMKLCV